ncbi:MAG: phosphatidate cytidylyltransferase [Dysgonomonas sp.]
MTIPKNLITRILTGIIFVTVTLGAVLFSQYTFLIIMCIILSLAMIEFYHLLEKSFKIKLNKKLNVLGGLLLFIGAFIYFSEVNRSILPFVPYILFILFSFISELYLKKDNPIQSISYKILGQLYLAVPFSLLNYLVFNYSSELQYHYAYLLALLIFIWVNDSFAYLLGITLGKHKMFERISPKKSWEGFTGGLIFTILAGLIFAHYFTELPLWGWIGFALTVVIFGTFGDLIESLFKRTINIKDSGNILPGHGGILDRFDSFILAIPALVVYITLVKYFC